MPGKDCAPGGKAAWGGTLCHGDVFHIIRQCEGLANTLSRVAEGVTSRRKKLEAQFGRAGQPGPDDVRASRVASAPNLYAIPDSCTMPASESLAMR
jgi:hypothetical protein